MASLEKAERIGGVGLLGIPTFDFCVWALDTYTRGELLVKLNEHLPRFLLNPAFVFLCMCAGLGLLYLSHQRQLRRILAEPSQLVGVDKYRKNEKPGWLLPLAWVFGGALTAAPLLSVIYSLAYQGTPPVLAQLRVPAICKTADCFPVKPRLNPSIPPPIIVNAPGSIPILGNKGVIDHPTVNNFGLPDRHLLTEQRDAIIADLKGKVCKPTFGALGNVEDAMKYAAELRNAFRAGGCVVSDYMPTVMNSEGGWYGVKVIYHDETKHPEGEAIYSSPNSPEGIVFSALDHAHIDALAGDGTLLPPGEVLVVVGRQRK